MSMLLRTLTLLTLGAGICPGAELVLRSDATPSGPLVRLGDVARIESTDAAEQRRLANLPLMPAPVAGAEQWLSSVAIREMLAALGEPPGAHRLSGAFRTRIGESTPTVAPQQVVAARRSNGVGFRAPPGADSGRSPRASAPTRLDRRAAQRAEKLAVGAVQAALDARLRTSPAAEPLVARSIELSESGALELSQAGAGDLVAEFDAVEAVGPGRVAVRLVVADRQDDAFRAVATVLAQPFRLVAADSLRRGDPIVASAVRREPIPVDQLDRPQRPAYSDPAQVVGREATRPIRPGEPLAETNTAPPLLVRRGEQVTVTSGGGGVRVRMRGVAQADGRSGDLVPVETADGDDTLRARVVGPRLLAVLAAGPSVAGPTLSGGLR